MNDRIKQLKIQACKWASENAPSTEYENACDEKFAKFKTFMSLRKHKVLEIVVQKVLKTSG